MSQQKGLDKKEVKKTPNDKKSLSTKLIPLSLVISIVAIVTSGYLALQINDDAKKLSDANQTYNTLESNITSLKDKLREQQSLVSDIAKQNDAQNAGIKTVETRVDMLGAQRATPTKELYLQISIANIQAAIDYFILAKDVALFSGDTTKADELVDIAFDKVEASRTANIGASNRSEIKKAIDNLVSQSDIVKNFSSIVEKIGHLKYTTPENFDRSKEPQKNKYMKYLSSIVEIQDISKDQQLVATKLSQQLISDNLYKSLMDLQTAMYTNNDAAVTTSKTNLQKILKQYFIQNKNAKDLEAQIDKIQPLNTKVLESNLDKVIKSLTEQQDRLMVSSVNQFKDVAKKGSEDGKNS
ncbi:hypothetical protein [Francisella adeliensis]|uniref:hypothetical protein n=1 Tax=Francisella adeliensis TaxID=2007306 RepID=UPI0019057301|nr:hypothetical protein [Francisella adeliensis]MBK2096202.1 hypothetical protein [Francisella adeliensis]QIW14441.1 hypothetical protein FZC44_07865 [Francisella adeliensis]